MAKRSVCFVMLFVVVATFALSSCNSVNLPPEDTLEYYTVWFNTDGGDEILQKKIEQGKEFALPIASKTDYEFLGWYEDADFSGERLAEKYRPTGDITLYAKWKKISEEPIDPEPTAQYTLTFVVDGGMPCQPLTYEAGTEIAFPTTLKEGFKFDGWFLDEALTEAVDFLVMPAENRTLYAKFTSDIFKFTMRDDKTYSVTLSENAVVPVRLVIPGSYRLRKVTTIEANAFCESENLQELVISENILRIGERAFSECINLRRVKIADSVHTVDTLAFRGCDRVADLECPYMDIESVFLRVPKHLTTLKLTSGDTIEDDFLMRSNVFRVEIADSFTTVGTNAFKDCSSLKCVTFGKAMTSIGAGSFSNNHDDMVTVFRSKQLPDFDIESHMFFVAEGCIEECKQKVGKTSVYNENLFDDGMMNFEHRTPMDIYGNCYVNDDNFSKIGGFGTGALYVKVSDFESKIDEFIAALKKAMFYRSLNCVIVPDGTADLLKQKFESENVSLLDRIAEEKDVREDGLVIRDGVFIAYVGRSNEVVIPDNVTDGYPANAAVYRKNKLTTVVTSLVCKADINYSTYSGERIVEYVSYANRTLHSGFAYNSYQLETIELRGGVTGFKWEVNFVLPSTVKQVKFFQAPPAKQDKFSWGYMFGGNSLPYSPAIAVVPTQWKSNYQNVLGSSYYVLTEDELENDYLAGKSKSELKKYFGTESAPVIPPAYTTIGSGAFESNDYLKTVTIPSTVKELAYGAFMSCYRLKKVEINAKLLSIPGAAFANCYELTSVNIPNSVTEIGMWAFYRCRSLLSITIPVSVKRIGRDAFYQHHPLNVYYGGSVSQWKAITFGDDYPFFEQSKIYCTNGTITIEYNKNCL